MVLHSWKIENARVEGGSTLGGGLTKWVEYRAGSGMGGLLSPETCSRLTLTELPTASPAMHYIELHSVHPAQRLAVDLMT